MVNELVDLFREGLNFGVAISLVVFLISYGSSLIPKLFKKII